jgi:hypothetical protein
MGFRKKARNKMKAERKVSATKRRRKKAKRLANENSSE